MYSLHNHSGIVSGIVICLVCLISFLMIATVQGADDSFEGFLGDSIALHGVSYTGDQVYLFLTGPNLPENGVTLSDISQRADQGHFTVVGLDSNQEWTYTWDTKRIESEIDAGTYTVYVTNEPVDLADLGGSNSYQTLTVYLKDSGVSKVSINAGSSYTLKPEEHTSTIAEISPHVVTSPVPATLTPTPTTMSTTEPVISLPTTAKALASSLTVLISLLICGLFLFPNRKKE